MSRKIGLAKARDELSEVVNRVAYSGERYVLERRGKPLAALISADEYEGLIQLLSESGVDDKINGIPVHIHFDGERYFVDDGTLDLYGEGRTLEEAKRDYWLTVQEYYADLSAEENLIDHYRRHLEYLKEVFAALPEAA